jgi:uncharacterized FlgJ-related protein
MDASAMDLVRSEAVDRDGKKPKVPAGAVFTRVNIRPPALVVEAAAAAAATAARLAFACSNVSGIATKLRSSAILFGI